MRSPVATPAERRVEVGGGVGLRTLVWEPDPPRASGGPPFLLVHGLASNCRTWEGVGARLHGLGHRVAAVDLRGHGRSDKPDGGYDFATLAGDLCEVIVALGYERPVVAGQSTGGNIALELGARSPERVCEVVGVDGGVIELQDRWPAWEDCARELAPPQFSGRRQADVDTHLRRAHPTWSDEGVEATLANFEVLADGTIRPWLSFERHMRILRSLWEHRPSAVLGELKVPLLLLLAGPDEGPGATTRLEADRATALASTSRARWFPGADHDLHVQHPDEVAAELHRSVAPVSSAGDGPAGS